MPQVHLMMEGVRHALIGSVVFLVLVVHVKHLHPDLWSDDLAQLLFASSASEHDERHRHPGLVVLTVATSPNQELCR